MNESHNSGPAQQGIEGVGVVAVVGAVLTVMQVVELLRDVPEGKRTRPWVGCYRHCCQFFLALEQVIFVCK